MPKFDPKFDKGYGQSLCSVRLGKPCGIRIFSKMTDNKILQMKEKILADIESVYQYAMESKKWSAAVQAKVAQAKVIALFLGKTAQPPEERLPRPQLEDLEFVFQCAMDEGKWGAAIQAKMAQARMIAFSLGKAPKSPEPEALMPAVTT